MHEEIRVRNIFEGGRAADLCLSLMFMARAVPFPFSAEASVGAQLLSYESPKPPRWLARAVLHVLRALAPGRGRLHFRDIDWRVLGKIAGTSCRTLYEMAPGGVELVGMTQIENDAAGRFRGIRVAPKWSKLLEPEVAEFLFREAEVMDWYGRKIPELLRDVLPGYIGPVGVDAMVYRQADGSLALRHVVELNVRMTMGRVALELQAKLAPGGWGNFRVLKKGADAGGGLVLNEPGTAKEFLAVWETP